MPMDDGLSERLAAARGSSPLPRQTRLTEETARRAIDQFRQEFPTESFAEWQVAGGVRQGTYPLSDIAHVVRPLRDTAPMFDPLHKMSGTNFPRSLVWRRLEQIVASNRAQVVYGGELLGMLWFDHYRAVTYRGIVHHVLSATPENFGLMMVMATGPVEFCQGLVDKLEAKGVKLRPGLRAVGEGGEDVPMPGERVVFETAGLRYLEPTQRRGAAAAAAAVAPGKS